MGDYEDDYEDFNNEMAEMTQRDLEEQAPELFGPPPDSGTKVMLYADAGLTHKGQPILSPIFGGKVTTEALMAAREVLQKGEVL